MALSGTWMEGRSGIWALTPRLTPLLPPPRLQAGDLTSPKWRTGCSRGGVRWGGEAGGGGEFPRGRTGNPRSRRLRQLAQPTVGIPDLGALPCGQDPRHSAWPLSPQTEAANVGENQSKPCTPTPAVLCREVGAGWRCWVFWLPAGGWLAPSPGVAVSSDLPLDPLVLLRWGLRLPPCRGGAGPARSSPLSPVAAGPPSRPRKPSAGCQAGGGGSPEPGADLISQGQLFAVHIWQRAAARTPAPLPGLALPSRNAGSAAHLERVSGGSRRPLRRPARGWGWAPPRPDFLAPPPSAGGCPWPPPRGLGDLGAICPAARQPGSCPGSRGAPRAVALGLRRDADFSVEIKS